MAEGENDSTKGTKEDKQAPCTLKKKKPEGKEKAKLDVHFYDLFGTQI